MMYAVIESGGKQYRVAVGDRVKVESLRAEPGSQVQLEKVLLVADGDKIEVGAPYTGATVEATVLQHGRGAKVRILKFRRRQNSRQHAGHRQNYTELEITSIGAGKAAAPKKATGAAGEAPASKQAATQPKDEAQAETKTQAGTAGKAAESDSSADLTQLTGVGPVLAEKLHDAGVTSLAQIAAWTAEDIDRLDAELNIKARAERDDWVGQAKKLIGK